jgi:hypothetical protein
MAGRDAELMHNSVANDRAKLISRQSPPSAFIAKLDVSGVAIRNSKLRVAAIPNTVVRREKLLVKVMMPPRVFLREKEVKD